MSYAFTHSFAFTLTHARELSSKVVADMYICNRFYGQPLLDTIPKFDEELATLLALGYVAEYEFGFKRNEQRVVCWRYTVDENGINSTNDRAGKIVPAADVANAHHYNYLWHSAAWSQISQAERDAIEVKLPIHRVGMAAPTDGKGYWASDKNYSAGGVSLGRRTFRPSY